MANKEGTMKIQHAYCKDRRGFTLVELLVVMVIVGLLVALVGPKVFPKLGKVNRRPPSTGRASRPTLDHFRLDVGRYPTTQEGLGALVTNPGAQNWEGPYLKEGASQRPLGQTVQVPIARFPRRVRHLLLRKGWHARRGSEDKDVVNWE